MVDKMNLYDRLCTLGVENTYVLVITGKRLDTEEVADKLCCYNINYVRRSSIDLKDGSRINFKRYTGNGVLFPKLEDDGFCVIYDLVLVQEGIPNPLHESRYLREEVFNEW
jgi:hypothetical protein